MNYPNQCMLQLGATQRYNYLIRLQYLAKKSHLCSIMSKQLIELFLVNFELFGKMLLHGVTPNNDTH